MLSAKKDLWLIKRGRLVAILFLVLSLNLPGNYTVSTSHAADTSQFFPQTNHTLSGKFLIYWQANGGLAHFGYPITDAQDEIDPQTGKTFLTQWFERARFELHSELAGTPFEVEQGLLGRQLNQEALAVDPNFQRTVPTPPRPIYGASQEFEYIPETGHNISSYFLRYWLQNGGVAQFGLPISEEYAEPAVGRGGLEIQWFERARFELHPELLKEEPRPPMPPITASRVETFTPAITSQAITTFNSIASHGETATLAAATRTIMAAPPFPLSELPQPTGTGTAPPVPISQLPPVPVLLGLLGDEIKAPALLKTDSPAFQWQIGSDPYNNDNFIHGIAVDSKGNIFASDGSSNYLTKYDPIGNRLAIWLIHPNNPMGTIYAPASLALDKQDNIYVASAADSYVYKFDPNGHFLLKWGGLGHEDGHFTRPKGISADNQGHIYVADTDNDRIQKFDSDGHFLLKWGSRGGYDGQFFNPAAVVPDNQGHVYVTDTLDNLIEKFDSDGHFLLKWGGYSEAIGKFKAPMGLVVDRQGNLYTLEPGDGSVNLNARVQKFDSNGQSLLTFGSPGFADNQFRSPVGIAIDNQGSLYINDEGSRTIKKFEPTGVFVSRFSTYGTASGQFVHPVGVATDSQDNIYVSDTGNARIQKFDHAGRFVFSFGSYGSSGTNGQLDYPVGLAVDKQGNIFVVDNNTSRIQKFDTQGKFVLAWGSPGGGDGQFQPTYFPGLHPSYYESVATKLGGLAIDSSGAVYVADTANQRVQKFDNQGQFVAKWDLSSYFKNVPDTIHSPVGDFPSPLGPTAIAIDTQNNVYVVSTIKNLVLKFDTQGNLLLKWAAAQSDPQNQLPYSPLGVAVDTAGNVYCTDTYDQSVEKFDANGHLLQQWGSFQNGFSYPHAPYRGIALDSGSNLLLIDFGGSQLFKFRQP